MAPLPDDEGEVFRFQFFKQYYFGVKNCMTEKRAMEKNVLTVLHFNGPRLVRLPARARFRAALRDRRRLG